MQIVNYRRWRFRLPQYEHLARKTRTPVQFREKRPPKAVVL